MSSVSINDIEPSKDVFAWFAEVIPTRTQEVLYHYTSLSSLLGILDKRSLWATDARFLNDPGETQYAHKVISEELEETCKDWKPEEASCVRTFTDRFRTVNQHWRPFFISFSANGDLLNQWIAYTPDAAGVAIGMEPSFLSGSPSQFMLMSVIYDPSKQREIVRQIINRHLEPISVALRQPGQPMISQVGAFFGVLLLKCVLSFKDAAYENEREWRLCFLRRTEATTPSIKYRAATRTIIPYIELPLPSETLSDSPNPASERLPIREVVLGPGLDRALTLESARGLLESHGVLVIRESRIPFRLFR
jgi:hypothetical protein